MGEKQLGPVPNQSVQAPKQALLVNQQFIATVRVYRLTAEALYPGNYIVDEHRSRTACRRGIVSGTEADSELVGSMVYAFPESYVRYVFIEEWYRGSVKTH